MSYSMDFRLRVVAALEAGASMWSVAQRLGVSHPTVRAWRDRAREGRLEPDKPGPTKPRVLTEADDQLMREQIAARPGITAKELMAMISVDVVESTVCRRLNKLGLRLKKVNERRGAGAAGRGPAAAELPHRPPIRGPRAVRVSR